jgi:murein DD-endopeptidase MepM/ murein hydrolase activator NlpD
MRRLAAAVALIALLLPGGAAVAKPDPRWVFYTDDTTWYTSPWFGGQHRIMIPFGCTEAPYYSPDPRCEDGHGFHHGIDVAMACGTKLYAARRATVVVPGSLGPAYGTTPLRLHTANWDLVIGHTRKRFVAPGDEVGRGQLVALASDNGAPDGCPLHFEKRTPGGGLDTATYPRGLLDLTAVVR